MYAYQTLARTNKGELAHNSDKSSMFNRNKLLSNVGKSHSNVMIGLSRDIEHNLNNLSVGQASNGLIYSDGQFKSSDNSDQR